MKKISLLYFLLVTLLFAGTGCLKDKDFEDKKYGIDITEVKGVAFTQTPSSPVVVGITGQAAPLTVTGPYLTLEGSGPATSDVHVKLEYDQAAVTAAGLEPIPAGNFSLNTLDVVIPKDSSFVNNLQLTIKNSNQLDPNKKYGVGFKIVSVDNGYQIASNMSTVIIGFAIKNKYDGVYRLQGHHNRVPYNFPYDTEIHLITLGPNSVYFYWPDVKSKGHPIGVGPDPVNDLSWYGDGIAPAIVFDLNTDLVTNVYNYTPGTVITMFTGAGSRISKFDPATHNITVDWNYNNNALRAFFDDLTYIGPRP
jgi:hypothetical protein